MSEAVRPSVKTTPSLQASIVVFKDISGRGPVVSVSVNFGLIGLVQCLSILPRVKSISNVSASSTARPWDACR